MAQIRIGENMSVEKALRKFRSMCKKEGIIDEVKRRRSYEKPSSRKRRRDRKHSRGRNQS